MTLNSVLFMLLGAALVAIGVLASALADRLRGLRVSREAAPRERAGRTQAAPAVISVVEPVAKPPRAARAESKVAAGTDGGEDVIAALVAAGYKKMVATEAAWACSLAERATIEGWTVAALRRSRGGMS